MTAIPNIESANNNGFLWPPIADAVDTFLRRRHNNADPYERVWRLIHLWEAAEITLSLATMARLAAEDTATQMLRRQREFFHGRTWDQVTGSFKSMQGAADGAIDQWINILDEVAKSNEPPGRFLVSLRSLLTTAVIDMSPFVDAWAKACDVPPEFKKPTPVEVRIAMRYVNSFRNRLAHVPFPHDPLGDVADALETATEQLFSIAPVPSAHEKAGSSSALTGAFRIGRCFLHGGQMDSVSQETPEGIQFVFPCQKRGEGIELWSAGPLLHVDTMIRPHILTRIKGRDVCEYTRFRAEANAVLVHINGAIATMLAEPAKIEYPISQEEVPSVAVAAEANTVSIPLKSEMSMSDAVEAIRSEDYDSAISFFEALTRERPTYHIGWLRLGYSRREKAVRLGPIDPAAAIQLLKLSLDDLRRAAQHMDREYQAQAYYERSKSSYHLAKLEQDPIHRGTCTEDAEKAVELSDEKKFFTWWEHVETWSPVALPVGSVS